MPQRTEDSTFYNPRRNPVKACSDCHCCVYYTSLAIPPMSSGRVGHITAYVGGTFIGGTGLGVPASLSSICPKASSGTCLKGTTAIPRPPGRTTGYPRLISVLPFMHKSPLVLAPGKPCADMSNLINHEDKNYGKSLPRGRRGAFLTASNTGGRWPPHPGSYNGS